MKNKHVIVVGGGPVGTLAAYRLALAGVKVTLCEAGMNCAQDLRASTFHSPTLEMLHEVGLVQDIIDRGLVSPLYHFRERSTGEILEFDLAEIADVTDFPYRVQCEQHVMASLVAEKLEAHENATVLFDHRLVHFEQHENNVTASFETGIDITSLEADYLIAADGGSSTVRKWLGVEFEGFTYPEKFLCLSTKKELADFIPNLAYVNYVSDPSEWMVLLRVPSVWRILVPAKESDADEYLLSDEYKEGVFGRLIDDASVETEHRTIYRVHQRVAKNFSHGRVFLVGDAAHLNNPLGGFGMNSGIHDAWNLTDKIITCLKDSHDDSLFELYDRQRRIITHNFIQAQTKQNKALLEHGEEHGQKMRLAMMREMHENAEKRREYLLQQSMHSSLADATAIV